MYKYSPSTNGFYIPEIHGESIPPDSVDVSEAQHAALMRGQEEGKQIGPGAGGIPTLADPAPPTLAEVEAHKVAIVQQHMDAAAQALRYDNITTAITYAEEPAVSKFQAEGQALRAWRSLVWSTCYAILDDVNAGNRGIPTDAELIEALPPLELPE